MGNRNVSEITLLGRGCIQMAATTARSVMDGKEMAGYPSMMIRNIFHPEDPEGCSPMLAIK